MEFSQHNWDNISETICSQMLIFGKQASWTLFFQNTLTNPIYFRNITINYCYYVTLQYSIEGLKCNIDFGEKDGDTQGRGQVCPLSKKGPFYRRVSTLLSLMYLKSQTSTMYFLLIQKNQKAKFFTSTIAWQRLSTSCVTTLSIMISVV